MVTSPIVILSTSVGAVDEASEAEKERVSW